MAPRAPLPLLDWQRLDGLLLDAIAEGHDAVEIWGGDDLAPEIAYDANALVAVGIDGGAGWHLVPVSALWRLVHAGITLTHVEAPIDPPPIFYAATSATPVRENGTDVLYLTRVADLRGWGRAAWTASGGAVLAELVRTMQKDARGRLRTARDEVERSGPSGADVFRSVASLAVAEAWGSGATGWSVQRFDGERVDVLAQSANRSPWGRAQDRIGADVAREAYGVTRHTLPGARTAPARTGDVAAAEPDRPQGHVTGEWTESQAGADPTGDVAANAADGTLGFGKALAAGIAPAGVADARRAAGLTERQALVLELHEQGRSEVEIGTVIGRHRSVVSRELRNARKKLEISLHTSAG